MQQRLLKFYAEKFHVYLLEEQPGFVYSTREKERERKREKKEEIEKKEEMREKLNCLKIGKQQQQQHTARASLYQ